MPRRVQVEGDLYHGRVPEGAIYVGRAAPGLKASPFHNVFRPGKEAKDRAEAVEMYRQYLANDPELVARARTELAGHDLACWCSLDHPCHGDVLLAVAAGEDP
ncbi:DUF4326 domain-containing protein [Rhizohabitans arisaemae]|uniref:DUF4326 domain-containing protein n=1 Tax=Rhizohabitans arisaemae TaxID=2720610 RepID=UPI0024B0E16D|nr:DUF4326 domain-containing protein [Rhizohabitans arisaemae]